ncbi:YjjG family noncanonical pyrimidine nucleotidase [Marinilactibacillus sp. Marseille-P9653]|uniref:YjjG family noncanonical pyrimidine nucleotidase n=1 Tax=Marinilactibacillus sp. Marseille-P9653 TaxID=2866583 RepID=UPI001CE3F841|nr:YjjG family noncanonical pyrimidine nucleotidase [Marinilactibacillus sp. Marseille-P9653]
MQNKVNMIFDLDDTILDFKKGAQEGLEKILNQYPVPDVRFGEWLEVFNAVNRDVWREIEAGGSPKEWLDTRFEKTYQKFNIKQDGVYLENTYRSFLDENFHLIEGAEVSLTHLKEQGYKLIAGTNGQSSTQRKRLKGTGLDRVFDEVIISDEIGVAKPDPRFFKELFDQNAEITPENTVMIGDSLHSDIQGAINAGMTSIWFNPLKLDNQTNIKPDYEVHSYEALEHLLVADRLQYTK